MASHAQPCPGHRAPQPHRRKLSHHPHAALPSLRAPDAVLQHGARAGTAAGAESDEDAGLEVGWAAGKGQMGLGDEPRLAEGKQAPCCTSLLFACPCTFVLIQSRCCFPLLPPLSLQALVEGDMEALAEADGGGPGLAPGELLAREAAAVPLNEAQRREAEVLRAAGITGGGPRDCGALDHHSVQGSIRAWAAASCAFLRRAAAAPLLTCPASPLPRPCRTRPLLRPAGTMLHTLAFTGAEGEGSADEEEAALARVGQQ